MPCSSCGRSHVSGKCADCRLEDELDARADDEYLGSLSEFEEREEDE